MELIERFRTRSAALRRPPGTAEVLSWVSLLAQDPRLQPRGALKKQPAVVQAYLPALVKNKDDLTAARQIVEQWTAEKKS